MNELTTTMVRVTRRHIDAGKRNSSCACAFALAVIDALGFHDVTAYRVDVGCAGGDGKYERWSAEANVGDAFRPRAFTAALPVAVIDWILAFDDGVDVEPFEVQLTWELAA